eukprot:1282251-Rhodomonas_salina.2
MLGVVVAAAAGDGEALGGRAIAEKEEDGGRDGGMEGWREGWRIGGRPSEKKESMYALQREKTGKGQPQQNGRREDVQPERGVLLSCGVEGRWSSLSLRSAEAAGEGAGEFVVDFAAAAPPGIGEFTTVFIAGSELCRSSWRNMLRVRAERSCTLAVMLGRNPSRACSSRFTCTPERSFSSMFALLALPRPDLPEALLL